MSKDKEVEGFTFTEVFPDHKNCDREGDLFRYFEGRLPEAEERKFAEHLSMCSTCTGKLATLESEEDVVQNTALDEGEADRMYTAGSSRMKAALNVKYPAAKPKKVFWWDLPRIPDYASAMMMLLLAVLVYPAYRSFVLDKQLDRMQQELAASKSQTTGPILNDTANETQRLQEEKQKLSEPSVSGSAIFSAREERTGEHPAIAVDFDSYESFDLVFALAPAESTTYAVEIAQGENAIWQRDTTAGGANPLISVHLQSQHLAAGDYKLRIYTKVAGSSRIIAEYKLQIKNDAAN